MILLGATTLMALYVGYLVFGGGDEPDAGDLATAQTKLFADLPAVTCGNPIECDTRAHDAYSRAKKLSAQANADPGNYYRAALEFDKAVRFRQQSGRPLAGHGRCRRAVRAAAARRPRPSFRTRNSASRAPSPPAISSAARRRRRCWRASSPIRSIPYRVKLDAYRRTLPKVEK